MKKIIDVSEYQGNINWLKAKANGVQGAVLRATVRSGRADKQLANNVFNLREADLPCDFYKYSYAMNLEQAKEEALKVVEELHKLGITSATIWADMEHKEQRNLPKSYLTDMINVYKNIWEEKGFSFGVYCNLDWYKNVLESDKFTVPFWIARYYNGYNSMDLNDTPNQKYKPNEENLYAWQYTSCGVVDGVQGRCDVNEVYFDMKKPTINPITYFDAPEFTLIQSLENIGVASDYKNRRKIAIKNGIKDYEGTADQNLAMLELLENKKLIS